MLRDHFKDNNLIPRFCANCGGDFKGYPAEKFCCTDCEKEYHRKLMRICPYCGKRFPQGEPWSKYCSPECKEQAMSEKYHKKKEVRKKKKVDIAEASSKFFECPWESGRLSDEITKNQFTGMMI